MKLRYSLSLFVIAATPVLAFEIQEIGTLDAVFDGKAISQPTVLVSDGDQVEATAYLVVPGGGFSSLNLVGFSPDNERLALDVGFMAKEPGPQTPPISLTITYAPTGTSQHWTSEEAPTPPSITFTTFEVGAGEGRAAGTFSGVLCYAEDYESGADTGNCHPVEGSFDTPFMIE